MVMPKSNVALVAGVLAACLLVACEESKTEADGGGAGHEALQDAAMSMDASHTSDERDAATRSDAAVSSDDAATRDDAAILSDAATRDDAAILNDAATPDDAAASSDAAEPNIDSGNVDLDDAGDVPDATTPPDVYLGAPTEIDFGSVELETLGDPFTLTITNTSTIRSTSSLGGVSITGNADDFVLVSNDCLGALAPRHTCDIKLRFTPTELGMRSASLTVNAELGGGILTTLEGIGLPKSPIAFLPKSWDFGAGMSTKRFTLFNDGAAILAIDNLAIATSDPHFMVVHDCGTTLAWGEFCHVDVTFTPTGSASTLSDTLFVTGSNDAAASAMLSATDSL